MGGCACLVRSYSATSLLTCVSKPDSSRISRTTVSAGDSPTSAHPPGSVHRPSERSRTSNTRCAWKTAPRTSTLGVAYPVFSTQEIVDQHRVHVRTGGEHVCRDTAHVLVAFAVKGVLAEHQAIRCRLTHHPTKGTRRYAP